MTPEQVIAALTALLAANPNPAFDQLRQGGYDARYPVTVENCPRPLPALEVEGSTVVCGHITVPENHDDPDGKTLSIAFAVLKAHSKSPAPDPVVYLHGGPGGHTVQLLAGYATAMDFARQRRDLVFFDERAGGLSDKTVTCYNQFAEGIKDFATAGDDMFEPDGVLAKCVSELYKNNVELKHYNTNQNARDVRAIMDALGYEIYNAYGVSYGTKLGQELMRAAPEGLRSIVLDSISRVDNPAYDTNGVPADQALGAVVDLCMADEKCAAAYPDLEAVINAAGERLAKEKVTISGTVYGPELVYELMKKSNTARGPFTEYLPLAFTELAEGKTATAEKLFSGGLQQTPAPAAIVAPYASKLSNADRALAEAIGSHATMLAELEGSTGKLLSTLSDDRSASGLALTEQLLDAALSESIAGMERQNLLAMVQAYARLVSAEPSRGAIATFVNDHVQEADLPRVQALVAAMTDDDVAAFFERASLGAAKVTSNARMYLALGIIACQEDFPFNSLDGFEAATGAYRFPVVDVGARPDSITIYGFCEQFAKNARPGFHDPVVSDIPTLAFAGLRDTQTNPDAAEMVVRTLENGHAFTFPNAGHGVFAFSQCAKDIAASFIENPDAEPNGVCIEELKPQFVLPDATMSGGG